MRFNCFAAVLACTALTALACGKTENKDATGAGHDPSKPGTASAAATKIDMAAAQAVFAERCAACHGPEGKGDGAASASLNPKPRNYGDKAWQASTTDDQLRKAITLGGAGIGKSPIMPASPDLESKPEVVEGLVKLVRKFGG